MVATFGNKFTLIEPFFCMAGDLRVFLGLLVKCRILYVVDRVSVSQIKVQNGVIFGLGSIHNFAIGPK